MDIVSDIQIQVAVAIIISKRCNSFPSVLIANAGFRCYV